MNVRLLIEYDGFDFCGWQRQANCPTIQQTLEEVLEKVTGEPLIVYGSSRTDSGVHAAGQVANFHTHHTVPIYRWAHVLNYHLPRSIRVLTAVEAPYRFHSQKSAKSKLYEYRILNREMPSALDRRVYFHPSPLDWDRIREALPYFLGEKDFKAFQGAKATVVSTVRRIDRFDVFGEGDGFFKFRVEGNGFLKQMVRAMVGTLVEIGEGKRNPRDLEKILLSCDRQQAGRTAPAHGLCLVRIGYDEPPTIPREA